MAEYNIGDNVVLKDDGISYKIVGVRIEDHVVLYDLEKESQCGPIKLTVFRSQLEVEKAYRAKYPQVIVYKKN